MFGIGINYTCKFIDIMDTKINNLIRLYHTKTKADWSGNGVRSISLSQEEIMENKRKALDGLRELSKEELIKYILNGVF